MSGDRPATRHARSLARARRLLTAAIALDDADAGELRLLVAAVDDWALVLDLADAAAFTSTLGWTLRKARLLASVPGAVAERLTLAVDEVAVQNAVLLADAARVARALGTNGIDHLFVKGTGLLLADYPSLGVRRTYDLDLHVAPATGAAAVEVLRGLGYAPHRRIGRSGAWTPSESATTTTFVAPRRTPVDLHWRDAAFPFADERARARVIDFAGATIVVSGREDLLARLCRHVVRKHAAAPGLLPRHLTDVHVLARRSPVLPAPSLDVRFSLALLAALARGDAPAARMAGAFVFPSERSRRAFRALVASRAAFSALGAVRSPRAVVELIAPSPAYLDDVVGHDTSPLWIRHGRRYARMIRRVTGSR